MNRPYKRKKLNYSVKKKLQLRLLFRVVGILLVGVMISTLVFYFYSNREIGHTYRMAHIRAGDFLDFLLPIVIISFAISIAVGIAMALFFPRAIAGPLYRIERELERLAAGDFATNIGLRRGDELVELADRINSVSKGLGKKMTVLVDTGKEMREVIENKPPDYDEKVKNLCIKLNEELGKYKCK